VNRRAHHYVARGPMVRATLAFAIGGLLCSALVVYSKGGPEPPSAGSAGTDQKPEIAKLYEAKCKSCHGANGRGKEMRAALPTMPDFTSAAWQKAQTDKDITGRIADGVDPLMPAFRDKLSEDEMQALTTYLRSFANPAPKKVQADPARRSMAFTFPSRPIAAPPTPEQLYRDSKCVNCHDKDGRGGKVREAMPEIPDFTDGKWQKDRADDALIKSILEGKGKFMVAQKDKLSKDEVKQLVDYVRTFKDAKSAPAEDKPPKPAAFAKDEQKADAVRAGAAVYQEKCLACHGKEGKGGPASAAMPNLPDFTSRAWQNGRTNAQLSVSILEGKGTLMPPFRDHLKAEQVKALLAYLRRFGPNQPATDQGSKASDFEEQFRQLEQELASLRKQLDELNRKAAKP
jgi:mono/diheme cytochrome c family protein